MSIDNGTCQLSFPLSSELPVEEVLIVRDIDVVGVGSLRRRKLEELQQNKKFILTTHEAMIPESVLAIYQAELLRTLQWLRPYKTEEAGRLDFVSEEKALFQRAFAKTYSSLGIMADRICEAYLHEMPWSSWLLQDHWRYFVGFLRQRFPDNKSLVELAHWEWVYAWLEIQPFEIGNHEAGVVSLNPGFQTVFLSQDNTFLQRSKGVYAFVYDLHRGVIVEKSLDAYEAHLIDLVQEGRKFSLEELIGVAALNEEIKPEISLGEWRNKCVSLSESGILLL